MDISYNEKTKKRLIALLLLVSCIVSTLILVFSPVPAITNLRSFAQADSLIERNLDRFNISAGQIRVSQVRADTHLTRKTYYIDVPPGFAKTLLHADLNRALHPLSVGTPAKVWLPEDEMLIHLAYRGTVFRSLSIRTDPSLRLDRNFASLLLAFDGVPPNRLLDDIISLGEPISVVLRVSDAREAEESHMRIEERYSLVCYWVTHAEPEAGRNRSGPLSSPYLATLGEFDSGSRILSFRDLDGPGAAPAAQLERVASENEVAFVDVSDARVLDSNLGESVFKRELAKFEQRARNGEAPLAIVMADRDALDWLREELAEFKKGGLYLVRPPEIDF